MPGNPASGSFRKLLFGFTAGFLSTLIFHQLLLAFLWFQEFTPYRPFNMAATHPFGIPAVFSLAFWGGLWGILLVWFESRFPRRGYWLLIFLFGAIFPSLAAFLIVLPLKGRPIGGGWHPGFLLTAFLINGVWGIGTGLIFKGLTRLSGPS
jgi:hypothetical protein